MRLSLSIALGIACSAATLLVTLDNPEYQERESAEKTMPGDWFYRQRAWPQGIIDHALRRESILQAGALRSAARSRGLAVAAWHPRGPTNIGGRITSMAISRQDPNILYAGAADGGVLKSTNAGVNWTPLFDDQPSLSIGAVAVDPTNDNVVYAGTGEANSSGDSYDGFGVVKSTNGGITWFSLGLGETRHIGKIVIDPQHPGTLYVAAMGTLFTGNTERGVYKSTDGGSAWTHVLFVNDSTGVVDLSINPQNPSVLLAASWERMRAPEGRRYVGGVGTGIYRTTDAGATWTHLAGGLPGPDPALGRPGIAIAPSNPSVMYTAFADDPGNFAGVYKSTDGGDTWTRTNDASLSNLYSNFGWYFGNVFVNPSDENNVYVSGVSIGKTTNGGTSWTTQSTTHADNHAMSFHPTDPNILYIGNDGGRSKSINGGASWTRETDQDLPISQFYAGSIDYLNPQNSIGGMQDNGTPRTQTGSSSDWQSINGGDGFYAVIDYTNASYQYAESQYGAIRRTTTNWSSSSSGTNGIGFSDRLNWSTPIVIDPTNPAVLYTGTQYVYRTTNRAATWTQVSPDLTDGEVPGFGAYATVTTIDVAPTDSNSVIAGTDDANVWITTNRGVAWNNVSGGLPNRWITRVRFDPTDAAIAYVTCSGYRIDSPLPHIFRTSDRGSHWQDISGNLPEAPINVVLVDPLVTSRLYVGTDVGCYYTTDLGAHWDAMGTGLPNVVISDMQLHGPTRIARAFTHGRSMWEISLDSLTTTGVTENPGAPVAFELFQNFPNPFNPSTTLAFNVAVATHVRIDVLDVTGRLVTTLIDEHADAGMHSLQWHGRDQSGSSVASGIYFCRMAAGRQSPRAVKMILVR